MTKILLVEDEDVLRDAFSLILATLPYEFDTAENGEVALRKCQESPYDIIFLDLMMPVVDGLDFLREFNSTSQPTKIIIMSNLSTGTVLDSALELGAYRVLLKSDISPTRLVTIIHEELSPTSLQK